MANYNSFDEWFNTIISRFDNPEELLKKLKDLQNEKIDKQKFFGNAPALKPETVAKKRRRGYRRPSDRLYATGSLSRNAVSQKNGLVLEAGFDNRLHPTANVSFSTLATWHNEGRGKLPKREFVFLDNEDLTELEKIIVEMFD